MIKLLLAGLALVFVGALSMTTINLKGGPDVLWQSQKLELSVGQGGKTSADAAFVVNTDLESVTLQVTPGLEQYVIITPNHYNSIAMSSALKVQVIFAAPADLAPGVYEGTLHIRAKNKGQKQERTFAKPLPVKFTVTAPPPPPPSNQTELYNDDGSAEAFDFNHSFGRVASFAKFDVSGGPVKIISVKLYLQMQTQPASPLDIYVWNIDRTRMLASPVRVTPDGLSEGWFTVDLSAENLLVSDEFYLGVGWPELTAPALLGVDLSSPQGTSYVVILSDDTFIPVSNSNMMIRAVVEKQS